MLRYALFVCLFNNVYGCPVQCVCDEHDKTAKCNDNELDTIPLNLPWFVQEVLLQNNNRQSFKKLFY